LVPVGIDAVPGAAVRTLRHAPAVAVDVLRRGPGGAAVVRPRDRGIAHRVAAVVLILLVAPGEHEPAVHAELEPGRAAGARRLAHLDAGREGSPAVVRPGDPHGRGV